MADPLSPLVDIPLTFEDLDDDDLNIAVKGSTTGAFAGEEFVLTPETGDGAHDSRYESQPFTDTDSEITANFVWNAETDLGSGFNGTVHVRGEADDGTVVVLSGVVQQTIVINTTPAGAVTFAEQRLEEGGVADIDFNLIDAESHAVTVVAESSLTGAFAGEEILMTPVETDPLHTLLATPLASSPSGISYRFVWESELDYGFPAVECVIIRFTLDDGVGNNVVTFNCLDIDVSYPEDVTDFNEEQILDWEFNDPSLARVSTLSEPFNLAESLKTARGNSTILPQGTIDRLNEWCRTDPALVLVGTFVKPFRLGDVMADLLTAPPFNTVLTASEIEGLNNWGKSEPSLNNANSVTEPFLLGDVMNDLLNRVS